MARLIQLFPRGAVPISCWLPLPAMSSGTLTAATHFSVRRRSGMRKNEWTDADDARLLQMVAQKRHWSIIAASLKRTRCGIVSRLSMLRRDARQAAQQKRRHDATRT